MKYIASRKHHPGQPMNLTTTFISVSFYNAIYNDAKRQAAQSFTKTQIRTLLQKII